MGWGGGCCRHFQSVVHPLHYFRTTVRVIFLDINHKTRLLRRKIQI